MESNKVSPIAVDEYKTNGRSVSRTDSGGLKLFEFDIRYGFEFSFQMLSTGQVEISRLPSAQLRLVQTSKFNKNYISKTLYYWFILKNTHNHVYVLNYNNFTIL